MSPVPHVARKVVEKPTDPDALILEGWAMGYMVGSLIIMAFITLANMRRGVLLHKLILLELILGIWQGFWLFFKSPVHAWWLSVAAILLNASWSLHNVIAWMKIKPFLSRPVSWIYIGTVILAQPYWILEIYANFAYFHGINKLFLDTRPWEALCRDPWWIFTTVYLMWIIKTQYEITLNEIIRISPRFGIMLCAMMISIVFIVCDICSVTGAFSSSLPVGINPFWKLAFVFKCLTDSVILDDFKVALDRLRAFKISRLGSFSQDFSDRRSRNDRTNMVQVWEAAEREARRNPLPSPDGARSPLSPKAPSHKDSVVSPEPIYFRNASNAGLNPEDMVPSALVDPPSRRPPNTRSSEKERNDQIDRMYLRDPGNLVAESDYAEALREVESAQSSSRKGSFPR